MSSRQAPSTDQISHGIIAVGDKHSQGAARALNEYRLRLQHLIMPHAARWQVRLSAIRQRCLRSRVLLGVVIFPFDRYRAVEADAIQLDEDLLAAIGITRGPCGYE